MGQDKEFNTSKSSSGDTAASTSGINNALASSCAQQSPTGQETAAADIDNSEANQGLQTPGAYALLAGPGYNKHQTFRRPSAVLPLPHHDCGIHHQSSRRLCCQQVASRVMPARDTDACCCLLLLAFVLLFLQAALFVLVLLACVIAATSAAPTKMMSGPPRKLAAAITTWQTSDCQATPNGSCNLNARVSNACCNKSVCNAIAARVGKVGKFKCTNGVSMCCPIP